MGDVFPSIQPDIAIIGGGIGGVALAVGLYNRGVPIQVYEAGDDFTELGAGIALGPNAQLALRTIDPSAAKIVERLTTKNASESEQNTWINFRLGLGEPELIAKVETKDDRKTGLSSVHRAKLLKELGALLPRHVVHFNRRLEGINVEETGLNRLDFADGTSVKARAVIGCDGVRSRVRQFVLDLDQPLKRISYTNKFVYRGLVPMDEAVRELGEELACNSQMYLGPTGHILTYPIDGGDTMNVVAFQDDFQDWAHKTWIVKDHSNGEKMRQEFNGWGSPVTKITQMLKSPDKWALFDHEPAHTYTKGKVTLMGDAAHATTPHQGAGAGMALEDAAMLCILLCGASKQGIDLSDALKAYDAFRRPRSQKIVTTSRTGGELYAMRGPAGDDLKTLGRELKQRMDWIWQYDVSEDAMKALSVLTALCGT